MTGPRPSAASRPRCPRRPRWRPVLPDRRRGPDAPFLMTVTGASDMWCFLSSSAASPPDGATRARRSSVLHRGQAHRPRGRDGRATVLRPPTRRRGRCGWDVFAWVLTRGVRAAVQERPRRCRDGRTGPRGAQDRRPLLLADQPALRSAPVHHHLDVCRPGPPGRGARRAAQPPAAGRRLRCRTGSACCSTRTSAASSTRRPGSASPRSAPSSPTSPSPARRLRRRSSGTAARPVPTTSSASSSSRPTFAARRCTPRPTSGAPGGIPVP